MRGKSTLKDIAQEAGVSIMTVSLVLRDPRTSRISPALSQKIINIASDLNYRPNYVARSLAKNKGSIIGLVRSNPAEAFLLRINPKYHRTRPGQWIQCHRLLGARRPAG